MDKYINKKLSILTTDDIFVGDLIYISSEDRILKLNSNGETITLNFATIRSIKLYEAPQQEKNIDRVLEDILNQYGPSVESFTTTCAMNIDRLINKKYFQCEKIGLFIGDDEIGGQILFHLALIFDGPIEIIFPPRLNRLKFLKYLYFAKNRNISIRDYFDLKYDLLFISTDKNYIDLTDIDCDNFIFLNKPASDLHGKNIVLLHYNPAHLIDDRANNIFLFSSLPRKIYERYGLKYNDSGFITVK